MPQQNSYSSYNQTVQDHGNCSQVVQNNQKKVSQIIQQRYHRRLHQHHPKHARRIGQARQAFRALRSLVKLQALVRGACARKQARIALHCMESMVRLQVKVRARQLLSVSSDGRSIAS
ncbi:protein IQ-DOMAIN 5-like isoform X3 [Pyrus x bretschneideri]|uniref:protein IQ-DOMAIN 5-like isoform X3 n=1 Tax=Pyrus x bretschneideri TaxID=225117 RepID=UPI00202E8A86|nr:protein IQ-DOMAIN 5-like isoform X3 [Pyrus x bretschneideri]